MFCHNCGKAISLESRYCNHCGALRINKLAEVVTEAERGPAQPGGNREHTPTEIEQLVFCIKPAFLSVAFAYAAAVLLSLLATITIANFGGSLGLVLLLTLVIFALPLYRHFNLNNISYSLTSAKVEIEQGIFSKTTRHIPLRHIQDVTVQASLWQRLMGLGDVLIDSAAMAGKIPMTNVRDPRRYAGLILLQMRR
jgi:membrane protein YdbS with pleckstrin-like domain